MTIKTRINDHATEIIISICSIIFSTWLMFSTFSYKNGRMLISTKAWSDFANHIPLIRSFAFGNNFPPQDPLFAGPPIHYHFLFFALTGLLEKAGLRIDIAFNLLSILGFTALLLAIYYIGKNWFHSKAIGILSIVFLVCNGSLSFLSFFAKHPLSVHTITDIYTNTQFPSFAPY